MKLCQDNNKVDVIGIVCESFRMYLAYIGEDPEDGHEIRITYDFSLQENTKEVRLY